MDSLSVYEGCSRDQDRDPGGCVCCQLVNLYAGVGTLTSNQFKITISGGPVRIGQIQVFGYGPTAQTPPSDLSTRLNALVGFDTTCNDYRMYSEYLPADGNYFIPYNPNSFVQTTVNADNAGVRCIRNGGYLATSLNTINPNDVELLRRFCNRLTNSQGCYVGARETYFVSQIVPRREIFGDPNGCFNSLSCTTYSCSICYEQTILNNAIPITFSTYPTNPVGISQAPAAAPVANISFTVPMFPGQISTKNALNSLPRNSESVYGSTRQFLYPKTITDCIVSIGQFKPSCTSNSDYQAYSCVEEERNYVFSAGNMDLFLSLYRTPVFFGGDTNWHFIRAYPPFCAIIQMVPIIAQTGTCSGDSKYLNTNDRYPYYSILPGTWGATSGPSGQWDLFAFDGSNRLSSMFVRYGIESPPATNDQFGNSRSRVNEQSGYMSCFRFTPGQNMLPPSATPYQITLYTFDASLTRKTTTGTYGVDWLPGVDQYEYLPAFVKITSGYTFYPNVFLEGQGAFTFVIQEATSPIYFKAIPGNGATATMISDVYTTLPGLQRCNQCITNLNPILQWMPQRFQPITWVNTFTSSTASFGIQLQYTTSQGTSTYQPLASYANLAIKYHQVTFLTSINDMLASPQRTRIFFGNPRVRWEFNSCGYVNAAGFQLAVCTSNLNYICAYDYTKYTVVSGTNGPPCGTSVRTGGAPLPGTTCFDEFPLANASAYPLQHEILRQARANTLDLYVDDYNLPTDTVNFGNVSVIWGFKQGWLRWKNNFSNRPGQNSRGVTPQLDFCDLSLTLNFPFDCGIQRNPNTKVIEQWCATNTEFCNLNEDIPAVPLMKTSSIPPIYQPSDITIAASDPTCGYPVELASFFRVDTWGFQQDDLDIYVNILQLLDELVQIEILSPFARWYNAGKTPYKYVFQANTTSNVAGRYRLDGCSSCVNPIMEVMLYSLTQNYTLIEPILAVNVSMAKGVTSNYQVAFAVSETETGVIFVNGNRFPVYTFRGIGYRFYNLNTGSAVLLFNPVITNEATISQCTSRTIPAYVEPPARILSSVPIRQCILTPADQKLFPGVDIGQCGCDLSSGDIDCDCPKVLTPLGSLVCGGVGSEGTRALGPDGNFYTTRSGTGAGCFIYGPENLAECKTINVGTAVYTLLTPGAIWDPPSVSIDSSPISGASIFINPDPETTWQTVNNVTELCLVSVAKLPYYFTADELDQLVSINEGATDRKPILMGVGTPTDTQYPWSDVPGTYFINNITGTFLASETSLDCLVDPGPCAAINWNNLAYGTTGTALTDGNVILSTTFSAGEITYPVTSSQTVWIYVFGSGTVSCTGGICDAGTVVTVSKRFVCNCPLRVIQYTAANYKEIQIFAEGDLARHSFYVY